MGELGKFGKRYSYSRANEGKGKYAHIHYGDIHSKYNGFITSTTTIPTIVSTSEHETLLNGDIIIADASENHNDLGKTLIIKDISDRKVIAGLHTFNFRPTEILDSSFYLYYTQSHFYKSFIYRKATGISVLGLSKNNIENMVFKIPSNLEQKKIGFLFNNLDNLITLHQRKLDALKRLKEAYLQNMFPKKGESKSKLRFANFSEDWNQHKLGMVANIIGGGTPDTKNPDFWGGCIDWYSPAEIGENIYVNSSRKKITELGLQKSSAKLLPVGTVLFTSRAGIGNTAILTNEGTTNQGFQSIVPIEGLLDSYFIFSRTKELKKYGETNGAGSTFIEVSGKEMAKMNILIPSLEEQIKIGRVFKRVDKLISLHQRRFNQLQKLKNVYLNKMFI